MTKRSSADVAFLLIGGRSVLSAGITVVRESREHVLEQVDGLGDSDDTWGAVGQRKFTIEQEGFFDKGTGSLHEALETADPQVLMLAPNGNSIGDRLVALSGVITIYNVLPARGEFHKANAAYKADLGPEPSARIGAPLTARTAASDETDSDDWGATEAPYTTGTASFTEGSQAVVGTTTIWTAAHVGRRIKLNADGDWYKILSVADNTHLMLTTAFGGDTAAGAYTIAKTIAGAVYLGVSALTLDEATNLTITVEHSINDSDWDTLATFTAVTSAPAAERKAITDTIRRYTRVTWEFTGAPGGDQTATFAVGIGRK